MGIPTVRKSFFASHATQKRVRSVDNKKVLLTNSSKLDLT